MSPRTSLTRAQRRSLILRALRNENMAALGREYGLDRRTVEFHRRKAVAEADERYEEAKAELDFWKEVLELTE